MRQVVINLPDDVAHWLTVCAANDDLRIEQGIEQLLTHLANKLQEKRRPACAG